MRKYLSIYIVESPRVGGSGRKIFICKSMGYGGKGEWYVNILECKFIIFISERWLLTQVPAAHPHPFSLHLGLWCFSLGAKSKSISIPSCWTIKVVLFHTYDVDGGSQLGPSLGANFFKNKGQLNHGCRILPGLCCHRGGAVTLPGVFWSFEFCCAQILPLLPPAGMCNGMWSSLDWVSGSCGHCWEFWLLIFTNHSAFHTTHLLKTLFHMWNVCLLKKRTPRSHTQLLRAFYVGTLFDVLLALPGDTRQSQPVMEAGIISDSHREGAEGRCRKMKWALSSFKSILNPEI